MKTFAGFAEYLRPGDVVAWGNAAGEPPTLVERLLDEAPSLSGISVFVTLTVSGALTPARTKPLRVLSLGGHGALAGLSRAGQLNIVPANISDVPRLIRSGAIPVSVALIHVSPPNRHGFVSLGVTTDYTHALVECARVVIAEINVRMPRTMGGSWIPLSRVTAAIEVDQPVVRFPAPELGEAERAIGRHVAALVPDGATIQIGYGGIPQAVMEALRGKNDLGVHSGMITDGVADLMQAGVVTNRRKPLDRGRTITGVALGTERLYEYMDGNPLIEMRDIDYTHSAAVIRQLPDFMALNSAVEVDLSGQVNAEFAGGVVIGGVGGQLDYVRAARQSAGGRAILALPATAKRGAVSRIVPQLRGDAVTCTKSEADTVVTEFGAARLYGVPLAQRAEALIEIAHPDFRDSLREQARALGRRAS